MPYLKTKEIQEHQLPKIIPLTEVVTHFMSSLFAQLWKRVVFPQLAFPDWAVHQTHIHDNKALNNWTHISLFQKTARLTYKQRI